MASSHTAVLLMAYGSPNRLQDVEAYFTDIRGGRPPSPQAVRELTAPYRRGSGPTPVLAVSTGVRPGAERALNLHSTRRPTYTVVVGTSLRMAGSSTGIHR